MAYDARVAYKAAPAQKISRTAATKRLDVPVEAAGRILKPGIIASSSLFKNAAREGTMAEQLP